MSISRLHIKDNGCSDDEVEVETVDVAAEESGRSGRSGRSGSFYLVSNFEDDEDGCTKNERTDDSSENSVSCSWTGTGWSCQRYKHDTLDQMILAANRKGEDGHATVLKLLRNSGIRVFVVDAAVCSNVTDIMQSIRSVIHHVTKLTRSRPIFDVHSAKRCMLFRDREGRFYNLTLASYTASAAGSYKEYLVSFSGVQAMCILVIMTRSFACATEPDLINSTFKPAYLSFLLGTVFVQEVSFSWIYTAMFVRGMPSISAYSITSMVETDWLRKILIFSLAMGSATNGRLQVVLTLFGISLACAVLLANLGSRAWGFMRWKPIAFGGNFEPIFAYLAAMLVGIFMPFMGYREMQAGGKKALETVLGSAFVVAVVFLLSDYDGFQKFLIIGTENCNQDYVNICVGTWFAISVFISVTLVARIETPTFDPDLQKPLLEEDHASPVGYRVSSLPDFSIDPLLEYKNGIPCLSARMEVILGLIMAIAIGGLIVYLAFTSWDEDLNDFLTYNETDDIFGGAGNNL